MSTVQNRVRAVDPNLPAPSLQASPLADHQPLAALAVSGLLRRPIPGHSALVANSRPVLGGPGPFGSLSHGCRVGGDDPLAGPSGIS